MDVKRSVNTGMWTDPWVEGLTAVEKLIFVYLLTNPHTNILGVYEISLRRIAYDTYLNLEEVKKALEGFKNAKKVYYYNNYIILRNFLKNQKLNSNMIKGAESLANALPKSIIQYISGLDVKELKEYIENTEAFQSLSKPSENIESEKEKEKESEIESESIKVKKIPFEEFWNLYDKKVGDKRKIQKKWDKLSLKCQNDILEYIPLYKVAQPDKKFRKNPETFFNNKSWNDELINSVNVNSMQDGTNQKPETIDERLAKDYGLSLQSG